MLRWCLMRLDPRVFLSSLFFFALTSSSRAEPTEIPVNPTATWVHAPSHFEFPKSITSFDRQKVFRYDEPARDISVGYNFTQLGIAMTVYVYPTRNIPLDVHFKEVKREVVAAHPDANPIASEAWTLHQSGRDFAGFHAVFSYRSDFAGQMREVLSEAYLLKNGKRGRKRTENGDVNNSVSLTGGSKRDPADCRARQETRCIRSRFPALSRPAPLAPPWTWPHAKRPQHV